jgi:hypothetical protein
MDKRIRVFPTAVGVASLLVIFACLCLAVFALLTLSTVRASESLSTGRVAATLGYYNADCQAEEILARLRCGEVPDGVEECGGVYTYSCPISSTQELTVQVELHGAQYKILRWQAVSTTEWQADETINVWDGELSQEES